MIRFDELDNLIDQVVSVDKKFYRNYFESKPDISISNKKDICIDNDIRSSFDNIIDLSNIYDSINKKDDIVDINNIIKDVEARLKKISRTNIKVNINFEKDKILKINKQLNEIENKFIDDSEIKLYTNTLPYNYDDDISNDWFE